MGRAGGQISYGWKGGKHWSPLSWIWKGLLWCRLVPLHLGLCVLSPVSLPGRRLCWVPSWPQTFWYKAKHFFKNWSMKLTFAEPAWPLRHPVLVWKGSIWNVFSTAWGTPWASSSLSECRLCGSRGHRTPSSDSTGDSYLLGLTAGPAFGAFLVSVHVLPKVQD